MKHPVITYANVTATMALIVALGGTSYAAVTLSKGQVKTRHIANNAVTSAKVKNRSLRKVDFARGQIPAGARGLAGAAGPKGDRGDAGVAGETGGTGSTGSTGSPGMSGYEQAAGNSANDSTTNKSATATCPAGKKAVGGGGSFLSAATDPIRIYFSGALGDGTGWLVLAQEQAAVAGNWLVSATAVCVNVAP
jgi:hypothetical protein